MWTGDWSSDVCSSDLPSLAPACVRRGRSSGCDRVEVELPVGARVECVLQAAAGGEAEGGGGLVGEGGGVGGGVELGGDAAAGEDGVPGELPGAGEIGRAHV